MSSPATPEEAQVSTSATEQDPSTGPGPVDDAEPAEPQPHGALGSAHQRTGGATPGYAWLLVITGLIGALASIALTLDYINLLRDSDYVPSCDINPLVGCGDFLGSDQASAFGFPNVVIGMLTFPVVTAIGVVLLAGVRLPRWFWRGLLAGTVLGIGFVTWLQHQSFTVFGALCPYCMVVWTVMIPLFVHTVARSAQNGALPAGPGVTTFLVRYRWALTALWYLAVIAAAMFGLGDRLLWLL